MTLGAILILAIWALAVIDMASEKESAWTRLVREAKRRAKEWTE